MYFYQKKTIKKTKIGLYLPYRWIKCQKAPFALIYTFFLIFCQYTNVPFRYHKHHVILTCYKDIDLIPFIFHLSLNTHTTMRGYLHLLQCSTKNVIIRLMIFLHGCMVSFVAANVQCDVNITCTICQKNSDHKMVAAGWNNLDVNANLY